MSKMVSTVFKYTMMSIIFVVIWQTCFYTLKIWTFNDRMTTIVRTMSEEVSDKNYLPESSKLMYCGLIDDLINQMNGASDTLFEGYTLNYSQGASNVEVSNSGGLTIWDKLDMAGQYGDLMVVEVVVDINGLAWTNINSGNRGSAHNIEESTTPLKLTYRYVVPCTRYVQTQ